MSFWRQLTRGLRALTDRGAAIGAAAATQAIVAMLFGCRASIRSPLSA